MGTEYFQSHPLIGILSNLPVLLGALALGLVLFPPFRRSLEKRPALLLGSLFVLTRIVFLILVVVRLRHVSLDLSTYFETQGLLVLHGRLPYRDFACSYAPLFPYLMVAPALFRGPMPFFLFFVACDLAALILLYRGVRRHDSNPARAARAAWFYAAAPVTWYFLVRYGQDEALAALFLSGAWFLWQERKETAAALLLGLAFAATKFTFGIFLPPFLLAARRPRTFGLFIALTIAILFAPFLLAGVPVWRPLFAESVGLGFGPSLWRLPIVFTSFTVSWPVTAALGLALSLLWTLPSILGRPLSLEDNLILTGSLFLVLSPKVMPMYLTPFWPFVSLWLARKGTAGDVVLCAILNLLLGVWWYFDAGGIQGMFGSLVRAAAVLVTAAIPVLLLLLGTRVWSRASPSRAR